MNPPHRFPCGAPSIGRPVTEAALRNKGAVPIRSVYAIGRNYAAHARELGNSVPDAPVVFLKPAGCLIGDGGTVVLPHQSTDVQHEVEIVLLLGRSGHRLARDRAALLIAGYGVGIDVTARDLQRKAQVHGNPWTIAKGFDTFGPISGFIPAGEIPDPADLAFELTVNSRLRQKGNSRDMLFDFSTLVAYLSTIFTLNPGDLIFTGTPEGVARIEHGDILEARLPAHDAAVKVTAASSAEA